MLPETSLVESGGDDDWGLNIVGDGERARRSGISGVYGDRDVSVNFR